MMSHHDPDNRKLHWPDCFNVRDMGGLPTESGNLTRFKALVRSDTPNRLNEDGIQALLDYGVRTIIDVRSAAEAEQYPSIFRESSVSKVTYLNLPLEKYYPHVGKLIKQAKTRGEVYCIVLDHYPDCIAAVMNAIGSAAEGGILIHCHAGKDRTGTIIGLCLRLVGVPFDLIAADYAQSQICLKPLYDELVQKVGGDENIGFWSKQTVTKEMMTLMLNHIDLKYGDTESYLKSAGLKDHELDKIKSRLLES